MTDRTSGAAPPRVAAPILKTWLHDGAEIALIDVREHGQFGEAHLFHAVPLPYSRLELEIVRLVPRRGTRIVLHDDGASGVAERAASRLDAIGYGAVHVLDGGTEGWRAAGYQLFAGVNVPSKTFGELVEAVFHTPRIAARDLAERLARGDDLVVLDGRPVEEYRKMAIPGAVCCPNGELALRADLLAPDPATTIVVNCAGRTRSIIGAQTLIDLGLPNPVLALENGTQGWYLDDLALEHGAGRLYPAPPPPEQLPVLRRRAEDLAARWQVPTVTAATVAGWLADDSRTTCLCDVRTPEEFAAGSLPGAQSTPGGQLLQATDQYVGTRGARLVLIDGEGIRAPTIAARLRQMGWEAHVLAEGVAARLPVPPMAHPPLPALPAIDAASLAARACPATLLDLRPSADYRAGHIAGAVWAIRPLLAGLPLDPSRRVVLIAAEPAVAGLAAHDLRDRGIDDIAVHCAGPEAWRNAGLPMEATPDLPADGARIDFLFFVHDRHSGNKDAARQYLAWETNLLAQIDEVERGTYRI